MAKGPEGRAVPAAEKRKAEVNKRHWRRRESHCRKTRGSRHKKHRSPDGSRRHRAFKNNKG